MTSGDGGPPAGRERKKFAAAGLVRGETNGASAPENHGLPRHGRTQSDILCSSLAGTGASPCTRAITPYITARSQPGPPQQTQVDPSIACWVSLILSLGAQRSGGSEASGTAPPPLG